MIDVTNTDGRRQEVLRGGASASACDVHVLGERAKLERRFKKLGLTEGRGRNTYTTASTVLTISLNNYFDKSPLIQIFPPI